MKPVFVFELAVALSESDRLVRIPLAVLGRWAKGAQKFTISRADLAAMVANFRKRLNGEVVVDYEHASETPAVAMGGPVPAAGWLKGIEDAPDGQGVLWGLVEFTERARQLIQAGEYKYISPTINWGARDKVTAEMQGATLTSAALTNRPVLEALPALALSEAGWKLEDADGVAEEKPAEAGKEKQVGVTTLKLSASDAALAVCVCGECGKETQVAVDTLPGRDAAAAPKVLVLSDVARTADGRFDFGKLVLSEGGADVLISGEVFKAQQAQLALDKAVSSGKILPAQRAVYERMALSDLAGFEGLVATMKPQIDLSERGAAGDGSEKVAGDVRKVDARIDELTKAKMQQDASLTYGQSMKLVLSENSELAAEKSRLMRQ